MKDEIAVEKIILKIKGKPHELTPDEARKLRDALISLLGPWTSLMLAYPMGTTTYTGTGDFTPTPTVTID